MAPRTGQKSTINSIERIKQMVINALIRREAAKDTECGTKTAESS